MKFCLLMFSLLLTGCQSLSMQLTPEESAKIIALSKRAIAVSGVLNAAELKKLDSTEPTFAYYFTAKPQADYRFRWSLTDGEEVVVSGTGDLFRLENAAVKRQPRN